MCWTCVSGVPVSLPVNVSLPIAVCAYKSLLERISYRLRPIDVSISPCPECHRCIGSPYAMIESLTAKGCNESLRCCGHRGAPVSVWWASSASRCACLPLVAFASLSLCSTIPCCFMSSAAARACLCLARFIVAGQWVGRLVSSHVTPEHACRCVRLPLVGCVRKSMLSGLYTI